MIKIITHKDLDGAGCALTIKYIEEEAVDISYCSYDDVNNVAMEVIENHSKYSKIYITDISIREDVAVKLDKIKEKVILFDHHPTALPLNKYEWANIEVENEKGKTCGTTLVYEYLLKQNDINNNLLCIFVELVRRYDTWEWFTLYKDVAAKNLNDLLHIKGIECFFNDTFLAIKNETSIFSAEDIIALEYLQREVDNYIESKNKKIIRKEILGYNAGIVFADNHISELGNRLSELNPELDFVAIINQSKISYRTTKETVNLSEVSQYFGGGGHPKASGSSIRTECMEAYLSMIFDKKTNRGAFYCFKKALKKLGNKLFK